MSLNNSSTVFNEFLGESQVTVERKGNDISEINKDTLAQTTKKISQLIAKSWLPEGKDIKKILLNGSEEDIRKLLEDNNIYLPNLGNSPTRIRVNWDSFSGKIEDKTIGGEKFWEWEIAYPPRPYCDVTDEELRAWVNDNSEKVVPETPYIPLTF